MGAFGGSLQAFRKYYHPVELYVNQQWCSSARKVKGMLRLLIIDIEFTLYIVLTFVGNLLVALERLHDAALGTPEGELVYPVAARGGAYI